MVFHWLFSLQTNAGKRAMALVRGKLSKPAALIAF
jgi:hypothetical protein